MRAHERRGGSTETGRLERQPCEICGARDVAVVGRPTVGGKIPALLPGYEEVRIVRCRPCGFYFADPMPVFSAEQLRILYSGEYFVDERPARWDRTRRFDNPRRRLDRVERVARRPIVDFLEVGCGEGLAMERARERGWKVTGQDVASALAEEIERRLGVPVITKPLETRPFDEGSFDVVYLDSVLEHVAHPRRLLEEIRRILRPGGVAYVIVPNEGSLFNGLRQARHVLFRTGRAPQLSPLTGPYHLVGFTPPTLRRLAESAGFRAVHLEALGGTGLRQKLTSRQLRLYARHTALLPLYWLGERMGRGITIEAALAR
jgi:SAM-dependent methyltransferase